MTGVLVRLRHCVATASRGEAFDLLLRLIEDCKVHFAREEALMALCPDYFEAFTHRLAHSKFLLRLERMVKVADVSGEMSEHMVRMVEEWWRSHVESRDLGLVEHLQRRFAAGIEAAE